MRNNTKQNAAASPSEGTVYNNGFFIFKVYPLPGYWDGYEREIIPAKYCGAGDISNGPTAIMHL